MEKIPFQAPSPDFPPNPLSPLTGSIKTVALRPLLMVWLQILLWKRMSRHRNGGNTWGFQLAPKTARKQVGIVGWINDDQK